ncbi:MAG: FAD-dependent oxidoreductase [Myxococcota bacterium]|nr:FAD-dependent oxidoreductase [Myxococcota bacterium]
MGGRASTTDAPDETEPLRLGIDGFAFADLFVPARLAELDELFRRWLRAQDEAAAELLERCRQLGEGCPTDLLSDMLVRCAPWLGRFVARLFRIEDEVARRSAALLEDEPLFEFQRQFARRRLSVPTAGQAWTGGAEQAEAVARVVFGIIDDPDEERRVARATLTVLEVDEVARKIARAGGASWTATLTERMQRLRVALASDPVAAAALADVLATNAPEPTVAEQGALAARLLDAVEAYLARRRADPHDPVRHWVSLRVPHKLRYEALVPIRRHRQAELDWLEGPPEHRRERVEPFALTDPRGSARAIAAEVDYCLYCHDRDKDSCSKGLRDKSGAIRANPLGVPLPGCPLHEKIGEMQLVRKRGEIIGALAIVAVDNPMAPGTGHRICNDCMKACVYQTQQPVNIPEVETRVLTDVLDLPWGFEIWSLLTRWNPLNPRRPYALPYNGKNVLVVGLGPAGYTLAHHLVNEGFGVIGIDGLKLEPVERAWIGTADLPPQPVRDWRALREPLESRRTLGFGGVSEYGITVRWDKNFLKLIYLNLLRRPGFRGYGGVRFGGTITLEDAWALGFDHVALCAGAGKPTTIAMTNNLARGVRKASDFLMSLQMTGAYKRDSLANLQVRLPAVVIGGGLTAIDTATELLAYYVVQAERTYERYEALAAELGEPVLRARFDAEELEVLDEVREHGRRLREERARAREQGRTPALGALLQSWGGATIVYRRGLVESPAYRLNHEEVAKSLEEGVRYVEQLGPVECELDARGAVQAVWFEGRLPDGSARRVRWPARTVCVAAGTSPNTAYEAEYPGTFQIDARGYYANHRVERDEHGDWRLVPTTDGRGFFTSYYKDGRFVTYYGDNHPHYAGSVVKAMASARDGHRHVVALFEREIARLDPADQPARDAAWRAFGRRMNAELVARVERVERLAPGIVEVVVRAPMAARKFRPGQFYRLQNYDAYAPRVDGIPMLMEGIALTGAWVEPEAGRLATIALEMGTSSRMLAMLRPGEPVVLMGPTGMPTEIPSGQTVMLVGGGLGNAVLFSIARALREAGSRVLYFAGYRRAETVFKREAIERSTDQVVWSVDDGPLVEPHRPQDRSTRGNIVEAMHAYARGELGVRKVPLEACSRVIVIGSDRMMAAVRRAREGVLRPHLRSELCAIASINAPMQCMLKAVCAQCLLRTHDRHTGQERLVYVCSNQDLYLDEVDFDHLAARLRQNSVEEKLANFWLDRALARDPVARI